IFRVLSEKPFNAEPPQGILAEHLLTPSEAFFTRNHLPVPKADAGSHRLELRTEDGSKVVRVSLGDLKSKFRKHVLLATLQCAGNRREEMSGFRKVQGLSWGNTAISTATWGGVLLRDVLEHYGMAEELEFPLKHLHFIGLDNDGNGTHYAASIPAAKALSPSGDVLLAWEMNGSELPVDHGYPLRVIVPGYVGARNVKWLSAVVLSHEEVDSHWQRTDYRILPPSKDYRNVTVEDYAQTVAIHDMPITSAICTPAPGALFDADTTEIEMTGFAFSGGGRRILRVDVSADGGQTWESAQLVRTVAEDPNFIDPSSFEGSLPEEARLRFQSGLEAEESDFLSGRTWHWALWSASVPVSWLDGEAQLLVKAVDESYNTQPRDISDVWNFRGLLNTSWHSVKVKCSA
ncbi:MAG: molybdopterin-dependent oxidoreductase, partial [archaeon]|nr:molybdopterin-dependent oxidoreductase [archaeon]